MSYNLPTDVPPALRELLAVFEAYRRLGFKPEEIFAVPECIHPNTGEKVPGLTVRAQSKSFTVTAPVPYPPTQMQTDWPVAAEWWNSTTHENRRAVFEASWIRVNASAFVIALVNKGFSIPVAASVALRRQ